MNSGIVPISNFQLALSVVLVLIPGLVSTFLKLGLTKSLAWGTVRTFAQLTLMGYVLTYIFHVNNLLLIVCVLLLMCFIAARTAVKRCKNVVNYPTVLGYLTLCASTFLVGSIAVGLVIGPEPWYSARVAIPICGMILGNSMNGISLALDRLYSEVRSRINEVECLLSFGANPWEAIRNCLKEALRVGMMPTINSLMVVGLVNIPGMMTGQILAGADPLQAARYQIVIMLMITAAAAIGCVLLIGLSYKRMFAFDGKVIPELRQSVRE